MAGAREWSPVTQLVELLGGTRRAAFSRKERVKFLELERVIKTRTECYLFFLIISSIIP